MPDFIRIFAQNLKHNVKKDEFYSLSRNHSLQFGSKYFRAWMFLVFASLLWSFSVIINRDTDFQKNWTSTFTLYTLSEPLLPPSSHLHLYWIRSHGGERVEAAETDYNGRLWGDCTTIMSCNYKEEEGARRRGRGRWIPRCQDLFHLVK